MINVPLLKWNSRMASSNRIRRNILTYDASGLHHYAFSNGDPA